MTLRLHGLNKQLPHALQQHRQIPRLINPLEHTIDLLALELRPAVADVVVARRSTELEPGLAVPVLLVDMCIYEAQAIRLPRPSIFRHRFCIQKSSSGTLNRDCDSMYCACACCAASRASISFCVSAICCCSASRDLLFRSRCSVSEAIAACISRVSADSFDIICWCVLVLCWRISMSFFFMRWSSVSSQRPLVFLAIP